MSTHDGAVPEAPVWMGNEAAVAWQRGWEAGWSAAQDSRCLVHEDDDDGSGPDVTDLLPTQRYSLTLVGGVVRTGEGVSGNAIPTIREVRALTGLDLIRARDLVYRVRDGGQPELVAQGLDFETAFKANEQFASVGAIVSVVPE